MVDKSTDYRKVTLICCFFTTMFTQESGKGSQNNK